MTIGILTFSQAVFADSAVLSASPATTTSTVGESFGITAQVSPATSGKVCAIKGTINFTNLSCQSIIVKNGLMTQNIPTCQAPDFTIGIPKCATTTRDLFTISAKGSGVGSSSVSFSGVKVIGVGIDIPYNTQSGKYNIIGASKATSTSTSTPTITLATVTPEVINTNPVVAYVTSNSDATQTAITSSTTQATSTNNYFAAVASVMSSGYTWLILIIVLLLIGYNVYYYIKKEEKQ